MSSSNTPTTLDFLSSSTGLSPILPSVSELLAQERLSKFIRPCLGHIIKTLGRFHPLSNLVKHLYQYKDEFVLLIESIIQWFYLHSHSALIGEHFYGLKRTADHRLRSIIFSVFLPYIKLKLDSMHKKMDMNRNNRHIIYYLVLQVLPKLQILIEAINWLYHISYGFGLTKYYSPNLHLASVKLTYAKDPSPTIPHLSTSRQYLSVISQIISNGLIVIQLIDWWNSSKEKSLNQIANLSLSVCDRKQAVIYGKHYCPLCQQLCKIPTVIIGSNYVYCNECINNYVKRYNRCPASNQPITTEHLYKIY